MNNKEDSGGNQSAGVEVKTKGELNTDVASSGKRDTASNQEASALHDAKSGENSGIKIVSDNAVEDTGNGPLYTAWAINAGIFVAKLVASYFSNSSSLLSEAIHSFSDSSNEAVLIYGKRRAQKTSEKKYEFGAYRLRYLASFCVALVVFFIGGVFALSQSVAHIIEALSSDAEADTRIAMFLSLGILIFCFVLESISLRQGIESARHNMKTRRFKGSLWQYWRTTSASELAVVMAEDVLALSGLSIAFIGLAATIITGDPLFDALGGAGVALVLFVGAFTLAKKLGGLLIGEGIPDEEDALIVGIVQNTEEVDRIIKMQTMTLAEDRVLICLKLAVKDEYATDNIVATNEIEDQIKEALPWYYCEIFIELENKSVGLSAEV